MNDKSASEAEAQKLEAAILVALTGVQVEVVAGPVFHDTTIKPLTREGAIAVLDRLRGRGFKVERV